VTMPPLRLDFSESRAKVDRASHHLDSLQREAQRVLKQTRPYTPHAGEVDQKTGWCEITLMREEVPERLHLAAIAGDVHHNLRSALDYIITALAIASQTTLTTRHQFPIFEDSRDYRTKVAVGKQPKIGGSLSGIKHGLVEIERFQPYNHQSDPKADPLAHLNRFSNADKHRQIGTFGAMPSEGLMNVTTDNGSPVIDSWHPANGPTWEADRDPMLARLRFAKPYPRKITMHVEMSIRPLFAIPPRRQETKWMAHDLRFLKGIRNHVRMVVEVFEQL